MRTSLHNLQNFQVSSEKKSYECKKCDYITSRKSSIDTHNKSKKHILNALNDSCIILNENSANYSCKICNKTYKNRSGLWYHSQKCINIEKDNDKNKESEKDKEKDKKSCQLNSENLMNANVICELIKQNNEFKTLLIEQNNKIMEIAKCNTNITNNTTTNNNQKFNMNFFLNEQCKGALDIMDFVNSLKVQLSDLENTGNVGYVKGISNIFVRGLKELDIYKRPIHCSDLKREVMYVKDNDVWEKDEDKKKIKKVIQNIAHKNFKQINDWVEENPESKDIQTKKHDQYMRIICKCTGGIDIAEDEFFYNKIISNVAKEVQIDK
uniref:C2H2-type domain-containing protein n=1 Tax=viral metagenome TaxID=1070528 RepID=A0A6C0KUJ4_9ZZZZ